MAVRGELAVAILPRRSAFVRTVAGRTSGAQVVAANLDVVLVVDALVGETRLRRVERYLAVAWSSGATPVVVLTKADLCDDVAAAVEEVAEDALGVEVLAVSSVTGEGMDAVRALLGPGRTAAMVGPSGVGQVQPGQRAGRADAGRDPGDPRGRPRPAHDHRPRAAPAARRGTARRHPGHARARRSTTTATGVDTAYADVTSLAAECRFRDCAHRTEPGCAVAAAIDDGRLDPARFNGVAQAAGRGAPAAAAGRRPRPGRGEGAAARPSTARCGSSPTGSALSRAAR